MRTENCKQLEESSQTLTQSNKELKGGYAKGANMIEPTNDAHESTNASIFPNATSFRI